jgi:Ca2+-binding RTX toxin-like protein
MAGGHRGVAVVAALALSLVAAANAHAGTVSAANGRVTVSAAPGEANNVTVASTADGTTVKDAGPALTPDAGCAAQPDGSAVCPGPATLVDVTLGDGDDQLAMTGNAAVEVHAGAGNDTIQTGDGDDILRGEDGEDSLSSGEGNDTLIGAAGNDALAGGGGDDSLQSGTGNDDLAGGEGNDTLTASSGNDALAGGPGNDRLEAGKGADRLDGGEGNDALQTAEGEFTGTREKRIRCGAGVDALTAGPADTFVSDCERIDGASLRLGKAGKIPLVLVCAATPCKGSVRIQDAKNKINASAPVKLGAEKSATVAVHLSAAEVARLFKQKKVRLTAQFVFGAQKSRATFTLLRRV